MSKHIELELLIAPDGSIGGAYLKLRSGKAVRTEVVKADVLLADYDKHDRLIGIDMLAPTNLSVVINLVKDPGQKSTVKNLMRQRLGDLLGKAA